MRCNNNPLCTAGAKIAPAIFLCAVFASSTVVAGEMISGREVDLQQALSGRTAFEAGKDYRPWRQFFNKDGTTLYFGDGPSSIGEWKVADGQYCSLWPPAKDWACYDVELVPSQPPFAGIVWIGPDGSRTEGVLFDGDLTALRTPPKP